MLKNFPTLFIYIISIAHVIISVNFEFNSKKLIECNVAILGSGFAGSFAAYKLSPIYKDSLCLIEKLDRDGGRIWDVAEYPSGPVFGMGALRMLNTHKTMVALAEELKIELQKVDIENSVLKVRGELFYRGGLTSSNDSFHMCQKLFRNVTCYSDKNTEDAMIDQLIELYVKSPEIFDQHPDIPTLINSVFGDEGYAYLRASTAYNNLLSSSSSRGFVEFLSKRSTGSSFKYYPTFGMSQYIKKMLAIAYANGFRVYRNEPVLQINSDLLDIEAKFYIETSNFIFRAKQVLCSIDPVNFRNITGNIGEMIKSSPEFWVFNPRQVAVVTAWWNTRWWEESKLYKSSSLGTVVSKENCFNAMLIPTFPYGRDQNVTRPVYDDGTCVQTWKFLVDTKNQDMLANEVVLSLQNVFQDVKVPKPKHLQGFVHNNAWYFQIPESKFSNQQIFDWSLRPVQNKNISLIGTAYNLNNPVWSDGALKSTMSVLMKFYNISFPCLHDHNSPANCPTMYRSKDSVPLQGVSLNKEMP